MAEGQSIILGVDPGTRVLGYGVVRRTDGRIEAIDYGVVRASGKDLPKRLRKMFSGLSEVIRRHRPDCVVVEETFYGKNVKAAITMGEGRGVALLAAALEEVPIIEYSPKEVKKAVVGVGSAHKLQVQQMVRVNLNLEEAPQPEDAADALALAICHCHRLKTDEIINR